LLRIFYYLILNDILLCERGFSRFTAKMRFLQAGLFFGYSQKQSGKNNPAMTIKQLRMKY